MMLRDANEAGNDRLMMEYYTMEREALDET